jgi:hypothetical protein
MDLVYERRPTVAFKVRFIKFNFLILNSIARSCLQIVFYSCRLTSSAIGCRRSAGAGPTRLKPVPLLAQVTPLMSP